MKARVIGNYEEVSDDGAVLFVEIHQRKHKHGYTVWETRTPKAMQMTMFLP